MVWANHVDGFCTDGPFGILAIALASEHMGLEKAVMLGTGNCISSSSFGANTEYVVIWRLV